MHVTPQRRKSPTSAKHRRDAGYISDKALLPSDAFLSRAGLGTERTISLVDWRVTGVARGACVVRDGALGQVVTVHQVG